MLKLESSSREEIVGTGYGPVTCFEADKFYRLRC